MRRLPLPAGTGNGIAGLGGVFGRIDDGRQRAEGRRRRMRCSSFGHVTLA